MNFYEGIVTGFEVRGIVVHIQTDAAYWIKLSKQIDESGSIAPTLDAITNIDRQGEQIGIEDLTSAESEKVLERLIWFLRGGIDERGSQGSSKTKERIIDYVEDFPSIYAAFMQVYRVDLWEVNATGRPYIARMHWWQFKALIDNIPPGTILTDYYMHYRGIDLKELSTKTKADAKHYARVKEIKQTIGLDKRHKQEEEEPFYAKTARERRQKAQ